MAVEADVLEAAANIVAAFGSNDKESYFPLFSPEATFVFHSSSSRLNSRAEYESEWSAWELAGFRIHSCRSSDQKVTLHSGGGVAVFSHTVRTDLTVGSERVQAGERESIVFELVNGTWIAVHEHLSIDPNYLGK